MFLMVFTSFLLAWNHKESLGFAQDSWEDVACDEEFTPPKCDFEKIPKLTVEDFERCSPSRLPVFARNYMLATSGRGLSYRENRAAFKRINIIPKMMRDVREGSLSITTLGQKISMPIGLSPTAYHKLAHPDGEIATATAAAAFGTVMILSSFSTLTLEEVAAKVSGSNIKLWMQTYIFDNRYYTIDLVHRAEKNGFKAIVLTVDSNIEPAVTCDAKNHPEIVGTRLAHFPSERNHFPSFAVMTLDDIKWLKSITKLPIVAKGILSADDARKAISYGASAIIVSNHGGRQMDTTLATIDVLPRIVDVARRFRPRRDVYVDGGIRNGWDVFKAIARGAKMVFIGRPVLWGLAEGGENGVRKVLEILRTEFNETMILSGASSPSKITPDFVLPPMPVSPAFPDIWPLHDNSLI